MAAFRLQVFKQLTGSDREWSNTYELEAVDLAEAVLIVPSIAAMEQDIHTSDVTITRALVNDKDPGTDVFSTIALNLTGTRTGGGDGAYLPLFNTIRVDINVEGGGRPSRKFYRCPVLESDQQAGFVDPGVLGTIVGLVQAQIDANIGNAPRLVDPDGQGWIEAVGFAKVQMRQLHRKRRKTTP